MQQSLGMEYPLKVTAPDGTVLWQGSGVLGIPYIAKNVADTAAILVADGVVIDPANFVIQADNLPATGNPSLSAVGGGMLANVLAARRSNTTGSLDREWLGICISGGPVGQPIVAAGNGSIVCAKVAAGANTVGHFVHATATAGQVQSSLLGAADPATNVGTVCKTSGATGGVTDTGSTTRVGVLVNHERVDGA